jgi:restriction system protein
MALLRRFEEYREFTKGTDRKGAELVESKAEETSDKTPLELLETAYNQLHAALAEELLDRLKDTSPKFFESVVVTLLQAMGYGGRYGTAEVTRYVRDGGIDGVIQEDKLGLDIVCIQAKRWQGTVGRPEVQGFVGSMDLVRAKKGVILTTGSYSRDAIEFVDRIEGKRVVLIDGKELTDLMIEHDIGVTSNKVYRLKELSNDFFDDDEA